MITNKTRYLYLLLIGDVKELANLKEVKDNLERELGLSVKIVQSTINPEGFFDQKRAQYHSTKLLKEMLSNHLPADALKMMGIISVDLFIPILTFVFGEAQLGGTVGIVSLARLRQEFYGLPPNQALQQRRLIKEIKHEFGHTFGLIHCPFRECVMSVANTIADVDAKGTSFCEACKEILRRNQQGV